MIYGYARVSTEGQELEPQLRQLEENGCQKIFQEKASAKNADRKKFKELLGLLEEGDTLKVTKLDRFARSTKEGIEIIDKLHEKGIKIHVLNMGLIDNTPTGKLIRDILLAVAQFEREMMLERQREGIELAKQKGKFKGTVKKYTEKHKGLAHALELFAKGDMTVKEISEITKVSRATIYREAKERGIERA